MGGLGKSFALVIFLILAGTSLMMIKSVSAQSTTPEPTSLPVIIATQTPTPSSTPTNPNPTPVSNIALDYSEVSRATVGSDTRLVLAINAKYNFGDAVTISFDEFLLNVLTERGGLEPFPIMMHTDDARPLETGNVIIGDTNRGANFQLTFSFPTIQYNINGQAPFATYQLVYDAYTATYYSSPTPISPSTISTYTTKPASSYLNLNSRQIALTLFIIVCILVLVVAVFMRRRSMKHDAVYSANNSQ
jgi:hypothetical protein